MKDLIGGIIIALLGIGLLIFGFFYFDFGAIIIGFCSGAAFMVGLGGVATGLCKLGITHGC